MSTFEINAEAREDMGKGASRRLRRLEDKIPAIVYGGTKKPQPLTLKHSDMIKSLEDEAFYSHILELKVDGKAEKVILKDLQRHPYKPKVTHVDFMRVKASEKLQMSIPLHFLNEAKSPGVKEGGVINHVATNVDISCLPKDLPEFIEVDLIDLEMDQVVHLSDIKLPKGVELVALSHGDIHDHDKTIATIHKSRASTSTDDEASPSEEGGEEPASE